MSPDIKLKRVEDHSYLYRDTYSKGIINSDSDALNKYKEARKNLNNIRLLSTEQENIKIEQKQVRQDLEEIKSLLYKLLENTSK